MAQLSEAEFERAADAELHRLLEALIAVGDELDCDLESGVMSIVFEDDTKYVVNSHRAARQIWMAAERSAWHFDYDAGARAWRTTGGDELWSTLEAVLARRLARSLTLR